MAEKFTSVGQYLGAFEGETLSRLNQLRDLVNEVLPEAVEGISYNIPAYRYRDAWAVYFSGYAKNISITFGGPLGEIGEVFAEELKPYKTSVSAIQFPHSQPLPTDLITTLIKHRRNSLQ
jgi:uncharacterized protein YdhG (YjbR/CyaY superfamily)